MEYICVFEYTCTLHSFPQIYSNIPLYKMKWNKIFSNILPRLYSNIIFKNIVKILQKFEVGYIQTNTFLESNTMWHPKGVHCNALSPCWWVLCLYDNYNWIIHFWIKYKIFNISFHGCYGDLLSIILVTRQCRGEFQIASRVD